MLTSVQIIGGLLLLFIAGEALVRGAVALARNLGVPILIIGLTIVALGTSAPEFVITIKAALQGHPDIATGNIIGSNIANILLVMGLSALIFPVIIHVQLIRREIPILMLVTFIFFAMSRSGSITFIEGITLFILLICYFAYTLYIARKERQSDVSEYTKEVSEEFEKPYGNPRAITYTLLGTIGLAFGADLLITGAVKLADAAGIAESVVGLTLVAVGSSLPELVTSLVAAWHKNSDIVAGNVVGSNLLNILVGISIPALITPLPVTYHLRAYSSPLQPGDIWVMLLVTIIMMLVFIFFKRVNKPTGGVFFLLYLVYISSQFIAN